ncbi:MAG: hypothetical protein AB7E32_05215, partial [Desulfovibrio sp.]
INFFPPLVDDLSQSASIDVLFKDGGTNMYLSFYAVKILLICSIAHMEQELTDLVVGGMKKRRAMFMEKHQYSYQKLLPKEWKSYIWHPG